MFPDPAASVSPLLVVADLERALRWWRDRVGAVVLHEQDGYALLALGAGRLHLAAPGDPPADRAVRLVAPELAPDRATGEVVVAVADCRTVVEALAARGVAFLGPPSVPPWGGEVRAFARDPDGHLVEFTSPHRA